MSEKGFRQIIEPLIDIVKSEKDVKIVIGCEDPKKLIEFFG